MAVIKYEIRGDGINRFGNGLAMLRDNGRKLCTAAMNDEGKRGRTKVFAALRAQTGISSHSIKSAVRTRQATRNVLTFALDASGKELNISLFGASRSWKKAAGFGERKLSRKEMKGGAVQKKAILLQVVRAKPWNVKRVFPGAFFVKPYGNKVFVRQSSKRFPLRQVFGPNISRELIKSQSLAAWVAVPDAMLREIERLLSLTLDGKLQRFE